jgi:hypothetical protein
LVLNKQRIFRPIWWSTNLMLAVVALSVVYAGAREYAVRQYLRGFADGIVPQPAAPEQKVEAILAWMRSGPPRAVATDPSALPARDPENTLNYRQLLSVCGTATNAFLNLSRSAGLSTRRLLLLTPERTTKHVAAEVLVDGRWIVVDPTYRVIFRDASGRLLTRRDLQDAKVFAEAIRSVPGYLSEYNFDHFAHVRLARLPFQGLYLRRILDTVYPGWEEDVDWSLLLERESFFLLVVSAGMTVFFLVLRVVLAWYADHRLKILRFHLREHILRAGVAFFSAPELKR